MANAEHGMIAVDKMGAKVLFLNPVTYESSSAAGCRVRCRSETVPDAAAISRAAACQQAPARAHPLETMT